MPQYGDCSFCGGVVKEEKAELDYIFKWELYIFKAVPTGICQQCGEKYLTAKVAKEIEHKILTKKKWEQTIAVPVEVFRKAV